jgi:hypothetical protein
VAYFGTAAGLFLDIFIAASMNVFSRITKQEFELGRQDA